MLTIFNFLSAETSQPLFAGIQWYVILLLCIGVVFMVLECFVMPGFGILGIVGGICEIAGIVVHGILSKNILDVVILILICLMVFMLLCLIFIRSARFGLLKHTAFVMNKTAVPTDYGDDNPKLLKALLGKEGVAVTPLRPSGKFAFQDRVLECSTNGEMIDKGETVRIIDIVGNKIKVEKVEEGK